MVLQQSEQCERLDCREPATTKVESTELNVYFNFCSSCAEEKVDVYDDMELVK